jgi:hypothetical protein
MENKKTKERSSFSQNSSNTQSTLTEEMKKKLKLEGEILFDFLDYIMTGQA